MEKFSFEIGLMIYKMQDKDIISISFAIRWKASCI